MNHDRHRAALVALVCALLLIVSGTEAWAHGVADGDKGFIHEATGVLIGPFIYLGAKHMVTGYDHLLFLVGVVFYLYRLRDVATYVTLFAVGHSVTLLFGVIAKIGVSAHLVDAVIGFSVVYKALDNLGTLERWLGFQPNPKYATLGFGLIHGFGLATKLLDFELPPKGVVINLVAFNVGVEAGQLLALSAILIVLGYWRQQPSFTRTAFGANVTLMIAGAALTLYQLAGYFGATGA
mgnify:CR=1 FL=1